MDFTTKHEIIQRDIFGVATDFIKIIDGEYEGVVFKYGRVEFPNVDTAIDDDELVLDFDFFVLEDNGKNLSNREKFSNTIGNLLMELISFEIDRHNLQKYLKTEHEEIENVNGSNHTEQLNTQ